MYMYVYIYILYHIVHKIVVTDIVIGAHIPTSVSITIIPMNQLPHYSNKNGSQRRGGT